MIRGGIGRIGHVAERMVPAAAGIYIIFSLIVILSCLPVLPQVIKHILSSAFEFKAAAGGTAVLLSAAACAMASQEVCFPTKPVLELWPSSTALPNTQRLMNRYVGHV